MGQEYNQNMQVRGEEEEEDDDQVIPHFVNMMLYSNASCPLFLWTLFQVLAKECLSLMENQVPANALICGCVRSCQVPAYA